MIGEGRDQEQASAICFDAWRSSKQIHTLNVSEERRDWYFKTIDRKRQGYHGFATQEFKKALQAQFDQFYDDSLTDMGMFERNLDNINKEPVEQAYLRVYRLVAGVFAAQTLNNFKCNGVELETKQTEEEEEQARDLFINAINGYVSMTLLEMIQGVTQTTVSTIGQLIKELQEDPTLTIEQFKQRLKEGYQRVILARSTLIGRTEIIRASNRGMLFAAASTGIPMMKIWVSTRDNRTRIRPQDEFDHWNPDGQERRLSEPFNITGEPLQYPGDPVGSEGNTINCRCTMSFRVV